MAIVHILNEQPLYMTIKEIIPSVHLDVMYVFPFFNHNMLYKV